MIIIRANFSVRPFQVIGIFDSGFGGLTVHRALVDTLPEHDFIYLGDNQHAPYGMKSPIDVLNLTCAGLERLFAEGCTLAILACNTASVVALRWIQQQWLPARCREDGVRRNVIGIVAPTIEVATRFLQPRGTLAIFATHRTVESNCYPIEIRKRRPDIAVLQQACPNLAAAIEQGAAWEDLGNLVRQYVEELRQKIASPNCAILGCTHYPLVAELFAEALPPGTLIIHQPPATALALKSYLIRHPEYGAGSAGRRVFLSTGFSPEALPLIEKFWGEKLVFGQS